MDENERWLNVCCSHEIYHFSEIGTTKFPDPYYLTSLLKLLIAKHIDKT